MTSAKQRAMHFVAQVSEEFILYKTAMHRRPVYRSPLGDIQLGVECLASFWYSYFKEDGISDDDLALKFFAMLDIYSIKPQDCIASLGKQEGLKKEAIAELEGALDFFAQKIFEGALMARV